MSASPMARQVTESKTIPTKNIFINDPSELPSHYSSTPGGTLYSTTPGGTKIVYEKAFLMNLRNSPISKTPPSYGIPESLVRDEKPNHYNGDKPHYNGDNKSNFLKRGKQKVNRPKLNRNIIVVNAIKVDNPQDENQFQMDL